jgi:hypothetical protein
MKQLLKDADYTYYGMIEPRVHVLKDNETKIKQLFIVNKKHASWGIRFKNTHLEYVRDLKARDFDALAANSKLQLAKMKVQVVNGHVFIDMKVGKQMIKKQYVGYAKAQAIKLFKKEYNV